MSSRQTSSIDLNLLYGNPTFRFCMVCTTLEKLNFSLADQVKLDLFNKWGKISSDINSNMGSHGVNNIKFVETTPTSYFFEGPAVKFPSFDGSFSTRVNIGTSVTVCVPPNLSKIWVRISCDDPAPQFDENSMTKFFDKSNRVSDYLAKLLLKYYAQSLVDCKILNEVDDLQLNHKIKIDTSSADLSKIIHSLEKESFKMSMILEDEEYFRSLLGFLARAYHEDPSKLSINHLPENYQWIKLKVGNSCNKNLFGIYSRHYAEEETQFSGIVHQDKAHLNKLISKYFSGKLIEQMAPAI